MRNPPQGFSWKKALLIMAFLLLAMGCNRGGSAGPAGKITLAGSTALLPLAQQAKELYEADNSGVTVNVSGGGSFTGITQVAAGSVDIGNSDISVAGLPEFQEAGLVDHLVAVAPFVIITHPGIAANSLTQAELQDIFAGRVTNWREVKGPDLAITIIHRAPSSGSRAVIKDIVLEGAEFTDQAVIQDSNGAVRAAISQTPGAIGYVDVAYLNSSVKALAYNGVPYTPENVYQGKYPVFSFEHMYTRGEPGSLVADFLDMVMGKNFQGNYVFELGFLPIDKMAKP